MIRSTSARVDVPGSKQRVRERIQYLSQFPKCRRKWRLQDWATGQRRRVECCRAFGRAHKRVKAVKVLACCQSSMQSKSRGLGGDVATSDELPTHRPQEPRR